MTNIVFGTDGWRGIIAENFTFDNVEIAAQAISDYVISEFKSSKRKIVVGYDRRFFSKEFADTISGVLCANGIRTYLTEVVTPTPAVSYAATYYKTAGAVVVTASHNPYCYNGIKFKNEYGGPAMPEITKKIESFLGKNNVKVISKEEAIKSKMLCMVDLKEIYLKRIRKYIDVNALKKAKFKVVVDTMFGAASGYINEIMDKTGCKTHYINGNHDPLFGGIRPEPIRKNLLKLMNTVRDEKADIGLATDGDGDRVGAVDDKGNFIDAQHIIPLLLYHFVKNRKEKGGVVRTNATTYCVKKIADEYGLKVHNTPIGFKYASELMINEDILIGGEESGGIGFKGYIPERDGVLACLLLLEMMAVEKKNITEIIGDLEQKFGKFRYDRIDLTISQDSQKKVVEKLKNTDIKQIAGIPVESKTTFDGVKFIFKNKGWLLIRSSGTEPIMRIYSEDNSEKIVKNILNYAVNMVKGYA